MFVLGDEMGGGASVVTMLGVSGDGRKPPANRLNVASCIRIHYVCALAILANPKFTQLLPLIDLNASGANSHVMNGSSFKKTDFLEPRLMSLHGQYSHCSHLIGCTSYWAPVTEKHKTCSFHSKAGKEDQMCKTETPTIKNTHGGWCTLTVHLWENMRQSRREVFFVNNMERGERCDLHSVDNCALPPPSPCIRRCQRSLNPHGPNTSPKWYFYNNWNIYLWSLALF